MSHRYVESFQSGSADRPGSALPAELSIEIETLEDRIATQSETSYTDHFLGLR